MKNERHYAAKSTNQNTTNAIVLRNPWTHLFSDPLLSRPLQLMKETIFKVIGGLFVAGAMACAFTATIGDVVTQSDNLRWFGGSFTTSLTTEEFQKNFVSNETQNATDAGQVGSENREVTVNFWGGLWRICHSDSIRNEVECKSFPVSIENRFQSFVGSGANTTEVESINEWNKCKCQCELFIYFCICLHLK